MSSLSKYSILIPVCNHDYVTVCFLILEVCSQYEQQNKSLFAKLIHSCPPLEISRHLISATGVYWIAILIAHGALTEYFFTWGWRKVRRQGADQSVMWSSSVRRGFALNLRKPRRKKNRKQLLLHLCVAVTTFKNTTTTGVSISFVILKSLQGHLCT